MKETRFVGTASSKERDLSSLRSFEVTCFMLTRIVVGVPFSIDEPIIQVRPVRIHGVDYGLFFNSLLPIWPTIFKLYFLSYIPVLIVHFESSISIGESAGIILVALDIVL